MQYVLGFDGGGTKTECVLLDSQQQIRATTRSGASNPFRIGHEAATAALTDAAQSAAREAGIELREISALCAGLAGVGSAQSHEEMQRPNRERVPEHENPPHHRSRTLARSHRSTRSNRPRRRHGLLAPSAATRKATQPAPVATVRSSATRAAPSTSAASLSLPPSANAIAPAPTPPSARKFSAISNFPVGPNFAIAPAPLPTKFFRAFSRSSHKPPNLATPTHNCCSATPRKKSRSSPKRSSIASNLRDSAVYIAKTGGMVSLRNSSTLNSMPNSKKSRRTPQLDFCLFLQPRPLRAWRSN